ncbi:MAG: nucleotidyl transferase AbiEii/AbiGii toxin family protein [Planctomycetia bacterium]|nr:nucleotidyl transferase AbiEii/AbiGii toxin family protein [Planctomycetia bacterium]
MNLHEDKTLFEQAILATAQAKKIPAAIVEKDYHVTFLLRELTRKQNSIVFKGGTSLSKCYHIINRFSEDIDLSCDNDSLPLTGCMRRGLNQTIIDGISQCGYVFENQDEIKRRRHFNRFILSYDPIFPVMKNIKTILVVETAIAIRSFPCEKRDVCSIVGEYLAETGMDDFLEQYSLTPYSVNTQTLERTFIDKVFAICDYWLTGKIAEHSRHLYDLCKLFPLIKRNQALVDLVSEVRLLRSRTKMCPSAKEGCDINRILKEIDETNAFKMDYENITQNLLFESWPYEKAKRILKVIAKMKLF